MPTMKIYHLGPHYIKMYNVIISSWKPVILLSSQHSSAAAQLCVAYISYVIGSRLCFFLLLLLFYLVCVHAVTRVPGYG